MLQYLTHPPTRGRENRAISSGVERHVDIVEVGSSKLPLPTNSPLVPNFFTIIYGFRGCILLGGYIESRSRTGCDVLMWPEVWELLSFWRI